MSRADVRSNGYVIALIQRLLQHSSVVTQRCIGIKPQIEKAIEGHAELI